MPGYDSFIVRIWSHAGICLHGQITHTAGKERAAFTNLEAVAPFIREHLEPAEPDVKPTDGSTPRRMSGK